ncbi:hypothetical protein NC653_013188 [Populus alba x Populus x berolinensis]|uniref:Uncharacterized protein n=1 Tax=Populus alba x Populus x berolinensis TaxID=444605 RepID=A0AAD6W2B3_9ROSI|nr:hypothetical protein NC653_013188 [Populus alba x Populus x berolinensis]
MLSHSKIIYKELRGTLFPGYCMFEALSLKDYREDNLFTNRDCTRQVPSIVHELSKDSLFEEEKNQLASKADYFSLHLLLTSFCATGKK